MEPLLDCLFPGPEDASESITKVAVLELSILVGCTDNYNSQQVFHRIRHPANLG
jgi:hypothetical protein